MAHDNHPKDLVTVQNVLVGDSTQLEYTVNGKSSTFNTKDGFLVSWDGQSYFIPAGESRQLYRFLADHFTEKLIDFILTQRESEQGDSERSGLLVNNETERERLRSDIILGEAKPYHPPAEINDGQRIKAELVEINDTDSFDIPEPDEE